MNPSSFLAASALALLVALAPLSAVAAATEHATAPVPKDELLEKIPGIVQVVSAQCEGMLARLNAGEAAAKLPRSFVNGKLVLVEPKDWTSGFFGGSLWYLYELTGDEKWKVAADQCTRRLDSVRHYTGNHDTGFRLYCSYGNGLRLAKVPGYKEALLDGAQALSTRFNPQVGAIKSWDRKDWSYPVIVDNMMNLELMCWATKASGDPKFKEIALSHANKTLANHFRPDSSSYHVVTYNPDTGAPELKKTWQGAADDSAWARGQAWGLYGYTMMYRETKDPAYLEQAKKIAAFILHHPRLPGDKIPYWDYDAPGIPNEERDASAGAVTASALIELSGMVEPKLGGEYLGLARRQLLSLSSPAYLANPGENGNFLLMHSVGSKPHQGEVDVPLNYADYYFLEALLRYRAKIEGK